MPSDKPDGRGKASHPWRKDTGLSGPAPIGKRKTVVAVWARRQAK